MKIIYMFILIKKKRNNKDHKFQFGVATKISKHKNIFSNIYTPNWSEEV